MRPPENTKHLLFGGTFVLANKLQSVGDRLVDGLSTKQWFLLRNLMEMPNNPPPTITQIAQNMDSSRQSITKMLEIMEREGYVSLEMSESDHRSRSVCITARGFAYAEESSKKARQFLEQLYKGISQTERDAAGKVMIKMMQNLEKMKEELNL